MPNHPNVIEGRDPDKCWRNHPDARVSCTMPAYHDGPHRNTATGVEWENLGEGQCAAKSGPEQETCLCNKDLGHDGQHQNGTIFWD